MHTYQTIKFTDYFTGTWYWYFVDAKLIGQTNSIDIDSLFSWLKSINELRWLVAIDCHKVFTILTMFYSGTFHHTKIPFYWQINCEKFHKMILFFDPQRNEICKILSILYIYITGLHLWQYIKNTSMTPLENLSTVSSQQNCHWL